MSGLLISLGAGSVLLCAMLAMYGFKGRVNTVGIDLGTTFSVVGFKDGSGVTIVRDALGRSIFPSVVAYREGGDVAVGYDALASLLTDPEHTVYNSKRFIGRKYDDAETEVYAQSHPFKLSRLNASQSVYSEIGFDVTWAGQAALIEGPEDVGARILRHLMTATARVLGHSQVTKAVIAVPAKFTNTQRAATAEAFKKAGLKVVRVMEEPTAAAVAYDLHKKKDVHQILVYDFGGGTLDVSLLYVAKESVQVYATDGDDMLGGSDFDICVVDLLHKMIAEPSHRKEDSASASPTTSRCSDQSYIRKCAEQIKKELSFANSTQFSCVKEDHNLLISSVSREIFEGNLHVSTSGCGGYCCEYSGHCSKLFDRSMQPVSRLLSELGMKEEEVDEVVLVGGTTRIPRIKWQLREFFHQEVNDKIDPDITVAYGAASIVD